MTSSSKAADKGLLATSGSIAVATLTSRITGFGKQVLLVTILGPGIASAFTVANVLPNMISELVLGAVLTQVVIPVLVRAEAEDPDGGVLFIRRLFTVALVTLGTAAVLATAAAPLLVQHVFLDDNGKVSTQLTTALAFLLLPGICFYGLTALLTAILNTSSIFKPGAWAPVLNNVVFLSFLIVYALMPGEISLNPVTMGDPKLLVLGLGGLIGVFSQVALLYSAVRRAGVDLTPKWGLDDRLRRFGGMAAAVVTYVLISQAGFIVATHVSSGHDEAGPVIYQNAWLLLMLPYGVIGVTLLTASMPRLSRSAAANDTTGVVDNLTVATRLTLLGMVPVVVFLTIMGQDIGQALYGYGNFGSADASRLGQAVSWSAFALIPYALVLLYLRVFYAQEKAWTPTWVVLGITGVKIVLSLMTPLIADSDDQVVVLLGVANGLAYITGAVIAAALLRMTLGQMQLSRVAHTGLQTIVASAAGGCVMLGVDWVAGLDRLTESLGGPGALIRVAIDGVIFLAVTGAAMLVLKVPEVRSISRSVTQRLRPAR